VPEAPRDAGATEIGAAAGAAGATEAAAAGGASPRELRFGDGRVEIVDCAIFGPDERPTTLIHPRERVRFVMTAVCHRDVSDVVASFYLKDPRGVEIHGTDTQLLDVPSPALEAGQVFRVVMEMENRLGAGDYLLSYGLGDSEGFKYDYRHDAIVLRVSQSPRIYHACKVDLEVSYRFELVGGPGL